MEMICPICLCSDKKLLQLPASLSDIFRTLLQSNDANINLCWECIADLRHTNKFKKRALKSKHISAACLEASSQSNLIISNVIINSILDVNDAYLNEYQIKYDNCKKRIDFRAKNNKNEKSVIVCGQEKNINNNTENLNILQTDITHIKKVKHARNIIKSLNNTETVQSNDTKDNILLEENNTTEDTNKKSEVLYHSKTGKEVDMLKNRKINLEKLKVKKRNKVRLSTNEFKCIECGEIFSSRGKYEYHKQKHRGRAVCAACARTFASRAALTAHALTAHGSRKPHESSYRCYCQPCGKFFQSTSSYRKHLRTSSQHVDPNTLKHKCPKCDKLFAKQSDAARHHDTVHLRRDLHACAECDARYCSARALRAHATLKHRCVQKSRNYVCEVCGWLFRTAQILKSHLRKHLRERASRHTSHDEHVNKQR